MKEMVGGCCVCSDEQGLPENPLVYCDGDGCTVAVHQACYGIITVPQGPWFCRRCESQERAAKVRCELCPQRDGALKKTDTNGWAHVVCALYIPEVRFGNVSTMEPIMLGQLPQDRWSKSCYICDSKGRESKASFGACMQCNKSTCKNYFHVTCAQAEGLLCEEAGNYNDAVKYCGYCNHHYKKILESSEKVQLKDSKRFTLVTTRKDYPSIKPIPAFRPIPSHIPGLKSPEVEKNKFNSSLSSSSSSLSSSSSSLSSFKPTVGSNDKHGSKNKSDDKFSRTTASDKSSFHEKDRKGGDEKSKDKETSEKDEFSKKRSKSSKDHHSSGSKGEKGSKNSSEKDKDKATSSNTASSVTSLTTSTTNCTGLSSLSTLNDLNPTTRLFDDRPSGQFSLSSFIDPKLASKNQSKKAAEKDSKTNNSSNKEKDKVSAKESSKSSTSSAFSSSNGSHTAKISTSKGDSNSGKNRELSSDAKSSLSSSAKNTHDKHSDTKKGSNASGHNTSTSKRKVTPDSKSTSKSSNAKKRKRFDSSSSSSSDSDDIEDKSDSDDSDGGGIKSRKMPVNKSKVKVDDTKGSAGKNRTKKVVASKSNTKASKKSESLHVNGTSSSSSSKSKSLNGTKQATSASKKKSKIISSDEDDDDDDDEESKVKSDDDDNSSNGTEPNLDDVEPKPKNKKASSVKESSSSSATTSNSKQEKRAGNKSNGYIPSPSPSLTPMTNKNAPTGHNVDMDRIIPQQHPPLASSFAIPPAPTSRQNRPNFPAKDPTEPPPSSLEALLERQWAQGANFILDQAQHYDIASLLSCLSQLRQDNERLEDRLRHLTSRREHLLAVNARLALPLNGSFNTSHGPLSSGNSNNAPSSSSSSSLPPSSSPFLPPPPQPPMGFQQLLNAAAVLQTPSSSVNSHDHSMRPGGSSSRSSSFSDTSNSNIAINGSRYPNDAFNNYLTSSGLPDATGASPSHHGLHATSSSRPSSRSSPYGSGLNSL